MDGQTSFDKYRMSNAFWERIKPLLPKYPSCIHGGRPRRDLRSIADAIFYRIRTGCQWKAIPRLLAPGSTAHQYFHEWVQANIFEDLWRVALIEYDDLVGLNWEWQSADGAMTKAPLGQESTGNNPTDRAKSGTKRSILTDANGIPVGVAIAGANVHDIRLLRETLLDSLSRYEILDDRDPENLCLDKGYDSTAIRDMLQSMGYVAHIRSRGEEQLSKKKRGRNKARRWVVERTHSWMNRFRGILIRWDKKLVNYLSGIKLVFAYIILSRSGVFG